MSFRLVVISSRAKLDYKLDYLVIRQEFETRIHISEISVLMIENTAVSLTAYLLSELIKNKVKIVFCDEKRNPSSELVSLYGSYDSSLKVWMQVNWKTQAKEAVWTEIVREKIQQQALVLKTQKMDSSEMLKTYANELVHYDTTNREGHAAKVYFNSLFGKDFSRSVDNPVNSCLNYGYSLLLSLFNREICANGYLTQLGLFHSSCLNFFNLSCDLMEPFRPLVDAMVIEMNKNGLESFGKEEKHHMLSLFDSTLIIRKRKQTLINSVRVYCKSIFDAINNEDISQIDFYIKL